MTPDEPVALGSRLELLVDDHLIERLSGGTLRLHSPVPCETALFADKPWEGNMCGYATVFQDGARFRMYYRGWSAGIQADPTGKQRLVGAFPSVICCAESDDGVRWRRIEADRYEFEGSRRNNIVWPGEGEIMKGTHGFSPFRDANPACPPEARYKAVGSSEHGTKTHGLFAMTSPDGVRWSLLQPGPIITTGAFDSQNLAFWDSVRGEYRAYVRDFREGRRCIRTAVSKDFANWTAAEWLEYSGAPAEQLYTNQVLPYYRAPHIFLGFPTRYVERDWTPAIEALPELEHRRVRAGANRRYGTALTDTVFMSSRDGRLFRRWGEAFIRPGLRPVGNWAYGDNYMAWGMLETASALPGAPRELSLYASENYWRGPATLFRRYTLRVDGFVSLNAPRSGAEMLTKPLLFEGDRLVLNISCSAAGSCCVEVQDHSGRPVPGYALDECWEALGDSLDHTVQWKQGPDVSRLAGKAVRLRFVLCDADLYSFRFAQGVRS